jgi:hypothetical protein
LPGPAIASIVARVPCRATTARSTAPLPVAFTPVAVVRCYPKARGVPGRGLWRFEVKQQADQHLTALRAALRRPSVRTAPSVTCLQPLYLEPPFALVSRSGRIVRPALPVQECGKPFPAAITDLQHLSWATVSVHRTVQLATRAELQAGCDPHYKDLLQSARYSLNEQPSPGGPAFSSRPPRLRVCVYQDSSHTFIRGGIISQPAESSLLRAIRGGAVATRCQRPHAEYAVLEAVLTSARAGESAEVEIGGCSRILRPDNQVGTVSPAGLHIIRAVGRHRS